MTDASDIANWPERIRQRYENYLKTSFFFKDPALRVSFQTALQHEGSLLKGPFPERNRGFATGSTAHALARECFPNESDDLLPALIQRPLYVHQERAVRAVHREEQNIVVSTGTASGKTESFLYPILFELYRQHLAGRLREPGVRAMILYPMNALANDQRERLGRICSDLRNADSAFAPTFGQYIGQTPEHASDNRYRNADWWSENRLPLELVFREEMREAPPHILLTNYSMLEYLLIRPDDSKLFDAGRGANWQFIVLDEAHQYRGAKGMEMGMLIRRLKQRLRDGGRQAPIRCIATSATMTTSEGEKGRQVVADFAEQLFGEPWSPSGVIFGESRSTTDDGPPRRYHAFLRALEGAFLVHRDGEDVVVLNRRSEGEDGDRSDTQALEIALCRECGQHYYVGRVRNGRLHEAMRDPSQTDFGVDYYLPVESDDATTGTLCRSCGMLSNLTLACDCDSPAAVRVIRCANHDEHPDQLKRCEACSYQRGGIGDPVQEIVHGSDGPNSVIATALHELLPESRRKVLAFADSRQEAAFFAWYAEDSYEKLRDRNLIYRAIKAGAVDAEGLSIDDLSNRLRGQWEQAGVFKASDTRETKRRQVLIAILREAVTDERRLSLGGVGLVRWFVRIPDDLSIPATLRAPPWGLTDEEARGLIGYLLDELRNRFAMNLPEGEATPQWDAVQPLRSQMAYGIGPRSGRKNVSQWGHPQSTVVAHFLHRLLADSCSSVIDERLVATELMRDIWAALPKVRANAVLSRGMVNGTFRLNPRWVRVKPADPRELWECDTCAMLTTHNIRGICPRNRCPGVLRHADQERLEQNHYRILYQNADLPPTLSSEEHTAQIDSDAARERQDEFRRGDIHLLSSSTTFEVGVDLGDLDAVFLRNVPPEPFNYTQRVGRAGRRETSGLALTYCRRNPHDLYHYEDPEGRVINGVVRPPQLQMSNRKIILRHMVATTLGRFFRTNQARFENVASFVGNWNVPGATSDLRKFCDHEDGLLDALRRIVPNETHAAVGLDDNSWADEVAGATSRLALAEAEVCSDYVELRNLRQMYFEAGTKDWLVGRIGKRMRTIADERTLNFLSRKAVIPKYGFPVDVVELDTHPEATDGTGVALQRDLSQAIAEYAPGGKVVANKLEWESCGVKAVAGKEWPVRRYRYDDARSFVQWNEGDPSAPSDARKYLVPQFGFVTPLFKKPAEPRGRARRLYTTRPFFRGFDYDAMPESKTLFGVQLTKALPGTLVILCEGKEKQGFWVCRACGTHLTGKSGKHKPSSGADCCGTLERFSLGHELVTDVVRLTFPDLHDEWDAYSVAYAVMLGAAEALDVPDADLNVTITGGSKPGEAAIVLYDNVPGGAGLVARLEEEAVFEAVLRNAWLRSGGNCGCDSSCYGCLRSYRNQFAHPHLDRARALEFTEAALKCSGS